MLKVCMSNDIAFYPLRTKSTLEKLLLRSQDIDTVVFIAALFKIVQNWKWSKVSQDRINIKIVNYEYNIILYNNKNTETIYSFIIMEEAYRYTTEWMKQSKEKKLYNSLA